VGFLKLTEILARLQKQYPPLGNRVKEAKSLIQWEEIVGPNIAKHSKAIRVENGILRVEVDHPIWKSELHHRKHQILERLNTPVIGAAANQILIRDIFFADSRPGARS